MASLNTKPALHYLDIGSLGRGEVVRLFLKDAGIEFEDHRYAYDDTWPASSAELQKKGLTITGQVPVLVWNGKILNQHLPIIRFLARELGEYDGETNLDRYYVDAVAEVYNDWRTEWVANLKDVSEAFKDRIVPTYYKVLEHYYSLNSGSYLLGDKISYADFAVYQSIDNSEKIGVQVTLPEHLLRFRNAFEARPRVAAYIQSR